MENFRLPPLFITLSERSAHRDGLSSPTGVFPLGDLRVYLWWGLDEPPGAGLLHGFLARGNPELAVDGFDLGSYRAGGDVETLRYLPGRRVADEEPEHIELALCELLVERSVPPLSLTKPALLSLQKLGEDAGVRIPLQYGPRLGE